jgi:hypothetical protein
MTARGIVVTTHCGETTHCHHNFGYYFGKHLIWRTEMPCRVGLPYAGRG